MGSNLDKYKEDLERLVKIGEALLLDLAEEAEGKKSDPKEPVPGTVFRGGYQRWYSEAREVIRQILPNRVTEFEQLYKNDAKRKEVDGTTYTIQDWLLGIRAAVDIYRKKRFNDIAAALMRFQNQIEILKSARARFESTIFEMNRYCRQIFLIPSWRVGENSQRKGFFGHLVRWREWCWRSTSRRFVKIIV